MSAFNTLLNKTRDRNWGGTSATVACEPYISGYAFIKWAMPDKMASFIKEFDINAINLEASANDGVNIGKNSEEIGMQLSSACMSVTPPTGTLNKVQFQGLGGTKWNVPGSIEYGDTVTIKYVEFSGIPIHRIHRAWCNAIRDNKIGLTAFRGSPANGNYNKQSYAADLLYWTTKPDGVTVEYAAAYSGVFPLKDPMDSFSSDINTVDKLEIDIDYNVDMVYHEDWVYYVARQEAQKGPYGQTGGTLWSKDGFRGDKNFI